MSTTVATMPLPVSAPSEAQILAALCRASFKHFVREFWSSVPGAAPLVHNWHIDLLCDELQHLAERVFKGLPVEHDYVFNVPPGMSKSSIASILFVAWVWTRMPEARFLCASNADALALDLSVKCRSVILSELYQETFGPVDLTTDQDTKSNFRNTQGGERMTATVGGKSPIGRHAHFHVCDDLVDPKGARSQAEMATARQFLTEVLPSRKIDKAVTPCILIMQRLAPGDPTDVMEECSRNDGATPVRRVTLPAEETDRIHPPELRKNYKDGLLDPRRLTKVVLKAERARMALHAYEAQYGQNPVPPGGSQFKCLPAGVRITRLGGDLPVEQIRPGDLVLTRAGWRHVLWAGQTDVRSRLCSVQFSSGKRLLATPEHLVLIHNKGFIRIESIEAGDVVFDEEDYLCAPLPIGPVTSRASMFASVVVDDSLSSNLPIGPGGCLGSSTDITLDHLGGSTFSGTVLSTSAGGVGSTSKPKEVRRPSTGRCGCIIRGLFRRVTISIIETVMRGIMPWRILSAYPLLLMLTFTLGIPLLMRRGGRRTNGTALGLGVRSTAGGQSSYGVSDPSDGAVVNTAGGRSCPAPTGRPSIALADAEIRELEAQIPVYDLTVEGVPEFFANGVLVHNSHWFNQRIRTAPYDCKRVLAIDRASTHDGGCFTSCTLLGKDREHKCYVEYEKRGQWEPDERNDNILALAIKFRAKYGRYEPLILIEDEGGASAKDSAKTLGRKLRGFKFKFIHVSGSKDTRAEGWASYLSSGNVWIVDNGERDGVGKCDWDVTAYVEEHVRFRPEPGKRLGGFKDQVDSTTLGYNYLFNTLRAPGEPVLRKITFGEHRGGPPVRFVVVPDSDDVRDLILSEPSLLVHCCDPPLQGEELIPPGHALQNLLGVCCLGYLDEEAKSLQAVWDVPMDPYGKLPEHLLCTRDVGRKLWGLMTRSYHPPPRFVIFTGCSRSDGRPLSTALACCDSLAYPRDKVFVTLAGDDSNVTRATVPPNGHAYDVIRQSRNLVRG